MSYVCYLRSCQSDFYSLADMKTLHVSLRQHAFLGLRINLRIQNHSPLYLMQLSTEQKHLCLVHAYVYLFLIVNRYLVQEWPKLLFHTLHDLVYVSLDRLYLNHCIKSSRGWLNCENQNLHNTHAWIVYAWIRENRPHRSESKITNTCFKILFIIFSSLYLTRKL